MSIVPRNNRGITLIELIVVVAIVGVLATVVSLTWSPTFGIWQRLDLAAAPFREAQARALYGDTSYFVIIDSIKQQLSVGHAGGDTVIDARTGQPYRLVMADLDLEIQTVAPPTDTAFFARGDGLTRDFTMTVAPISAPAEQFQLVVSAPHCRVELVRVP